MFNNESTLLKYIIPILLLFHRYRDCACRNVNTLFRTQQESR